MDNPMLLAVQRFLVIKSITKYVKETTQYFLSDRNRNAGTRISNLHISEQSLTGVKHDAANHIITDMLRYFHNAFCAVMFNIKCVLYGRKCFF